MSDNTSFLRRILMIMLIGTAVFSSGCATLASIPAGDRTRLYPCLKQQAFSAGLATLVNGGYQIQVADEGSGVITSGERTNSDLAAAFVGRQSFRIGLTVSEVASDSVRVTLMLTAQESNLFGAKSETTMTKGRALDQYEKVFTAFESHLECAAASQDSMPAPSSRPVAAVSGEGGGR